MTESQLQVDKYHVIVWLWAHRLNNFFPCSRQTFIINNLWSIENKIFKTVKVIYING